jgi:hypothetical protein
MVFTDLTIVGILPIAAGVVKKVSKVPVQYQPIPVEQKTHMPEISISTVSKAPGSKGQRRESFS